MLKVIFILTRNCSDSNGGELEMRMLCNIAGLRTLESLAVLSCVIDIWFLMEFEMQKERVILKLEVGKGNQSESGEITDKSADGEKLRLHLLLLVIKLYEILMIFGEVLGSSRVADMANHRVFVIFAVLSVDGFIFVLEIIVNGNNGNGCGMEKWFDYQVRGEQCSTYDEEFDDRDNNCQRTGEVLLDVTSCDAAGLRAFGNGAVLQIMDGF
jgi:hypothetical protein